MKHLFKRSLALLCVLAMIIGILPVVAAAENTYGLASEIKDGDKIVIVCAAQGLALSSEIVATYYKAGVAITPDGDTITDPDEALVWTVSADGDGFNIANAEGKKLSIEGNYSSVPYDQANDAWHLEEAETEGCVYVVNENGKHLSWSDKGNFAAQAPTSQYTNEGFRAMKIFVLGAEGEGGGEELPELPDEGEIAGEFVLLSTTDMHGRCWDTNILNDTNMSNSMLNVATAVKQMRETYGENVVLIDNGDTYQGTPVSTLQISEYTQGNTTDPNPMAISLKYIGYDLATVGNHEFNYAWNTMSDIYAYLEEDVEGLGNVLPACANLYYEDGTNVVEPYGIKTIKDEYGDEYKIAILAFVTPDCTRWDVPDNYPGMRFYHPDNAYRSIRWEAEKWVEIIEQEEAPDFVIVTFHSGAGSAVADEDLVYGENTENQVASMIAGTTGIDVVIAGHDHNGGYSGDFFQNADGEDVLVVNGAGNNLTASVFEIDTNGNISLKEHSDLALSNYAADAGLKALIKPYADAASAYVNNTCGKAIGTWNKITSGKNFYLQQSDTMDLIGRAQMAQGTIHLEEKFDTEEKKQALFAETGLTDLIVDASSTSVVVNGTYNVKAGDLSMKDIYRMYKYDNSLYLMPVTGAELRGFLEFNAATHLTANTASGTPIFGTKGDDFTNPIFYGLDFKYDLSREEYDRVVDLKFSDGREVVDEEVYIFAVNNYHLGNASGPFASYTTEDAIWSQTDDMGGGFVQDLIAEFLAAETAANGGVAPAPSDWEIVYTGEIVEGKAEGEFIGDACDPTLLKTGDQILIYYPAGNTLVSNIADGNKLAICEDVTSGKNEEGIRQVGTDTAEAVFTVTVGEDGMISFSDAEGKYITSAPTGNGLSMGAELNDLAKWEIEKTDGGIYLHNVGAAYNGNHNQYLEFYYAFTTYGLGGGGAAYTFEIFKLPAVEEETDEIVILYTNDVHTYVDKALSYDNIADMKATLEAEGKTVILVDAGDHIQGTAYGSMDKGATIIELMEAAGYDLATLGNHEFDYGMERALEIATGSAFPYISANFYHEENGVKGETVLDAYKIFEANGVKIAFVGMTTPESFTKSTPAYFQDENGNYIYGIAGGDDGSALYADIQVAIDAAIAEGADYVIGLGHLGDDIASQPWTSEELIANTTGLDAFIDGHSHSTVEGKLVADKNGNDVLLTQTGEYFGAIGKMTIGEGITTELVTEWAGSDEAVAEIKNAWIAEINEKLGEVIGNATITLDNYDADGNRIVRKQETNTGDFAADALYWLFDSMELDVDLAIMNGGGVRNKAITGELSYLTAKNIHTFGNVACLQTVTGQQILDALEWGARQTPEAEIGGFLHVSGITYEVDASIVSTVQIDDKGVWVGAPTGEYRVKNVKVYNKETGIYEDLDLTASYNMAGYNYTLRDLGDGFAMFDGAINVLDYVMEDYQVLATYIKAFPKVGELPTIEATNSPLLAKYEGMLLDYGTVNGSGRIVVAGEVEEPWDGKIIIGGLEPNLWTTKYGNVYTNCAAENFFGDLGLNYGDLATVKFLDQELILPVVPNYSYVEAGKPALLVSKNEQGNPTGYAFLAINMGNFLEYYGIANKGTDENGNWFWTACEGVEFPIEVTFELYEKEGYMAEYLLHELNRTNNREDYAHLSDEEFANFREVTTTGMGDDILYRSSSPINPELGRNTYADAAAEAAGIKTFVNLADNQEEAEAYEGFADSYYAQQNIIYLCLGVDFAEESFQAGLAEGFRYMIANEGPYLIHCTEGKDRAGFTHALLECFMGATYEEVVADYMVTYYNYYGVEVGSEKYNAIANSNIIKSLSIAFGVEDLTTADLASEAAEYLAEIGLTETEIEELYIALGGEAKPVVKEILVPSTLREGAQIPVYVTLPAYYDEANEYPVVFMLHGHGGNHNEWGGYDSISNGLAAASSGIIAVTLDFPGCGASTESFTLNTMTNMKSDVLDVIEYVTTNYPVNEDAIGAFGYSMGGRIVLEMIAEDLYSFDAIELVAPAEDYEDLKGLFGGAENWEVLKAEANANGYVEFSTIYSTLPLSKEWFADLEKYPDGLIELAAEKYEGRSLVIWATDDTTVSPWVAEGVAEALGSATLLTYTNGHSYGFYGTDPYTKRITTDGSVGFFQQELTCENDDLISGYIHKIEDDGDIILTIEESALAGYEIGDTVEMRFNDMFADSVYGEEIVIENGLVVVKAVDWTFLTKVEAEGGVQWYYNDEIYLPISIQIEEPPIVFEDVKEDAWYYDYVMNMAELGVINGMTATTFEPEGTLTRAQVATMLYRVFGEQDVTGYEEPFTDVSEADWFYESVVWAYNTGITNGATATTFAPNDKITREQLAVMLYRVSKENETEEPVVDFSGYEDGNKISDYAIEAMAWACNIGLINGTSFDNSGKLYLDPQGDATRAQAAKIFYMWLNVN